MGHEGKSMRHEGEEKARILVMASFRFQDLEIWQKACRLGDILDSIAPG